jgi:hypothetical protein
LAPSDFGLLFNHFITLIFRQPWLLWFAFQSLHNADISPTMATITIGTKRSSSEPEEESQEESKRTKSNESVLTRTSNDSMDSNNEDTNLSGLGRNKNDKPRLSCISSKTRNEEVDAILVKTPWGKAHGAINPFKVDPPPIITALSLDLARHLAHIDTEWPNTVMLTYAQASAARLAADNHTNVLICTPMVGFHDQNVIVDELLDYKQFEHVFAFAHIRVGKCGHWGLLEVDRLNKTVQIHETKHGSNQRTGVLPFMDAVKKLVMQCGLGHADLLTTKPNTRSRPKSLGGGSLSISVTRTFISSACGNDPLWCGPMCAAKLRERIAKVTKQHVTPHCKNSGRFDSTVHLFQLMGGLHKDGLLRHDGQGGDGVNMRLAREIYNSKVELLLKVVELPCTYCETTQLHLSKGPVVHFTCCHQQAHFRCFAKAVLCAQEALESYGRPVNCPHCSEKCKGVYVICDKYEVRHHCQFNNYTDLTASSWQQINAIRMVQRVCDEGHSLDERLFHVENLGEGQEVISVLESPAAAPQRSSASRENSGSEDTDDGMSETGSVTAKRATFYQNQLNNARCGAPRLNKLATTRPTSAHLGRGAPLTIAPKPSVACFPAVVTITEDNSVAVSTLTPANKEKQENEEQLSRMVSCAASFMTARYCLCF